MAAGNAEVGTLPLDQTFLERVDFHGRTFQEFAINNQIHFAPTDEYEIEREDLMATCLNTVFDRRLLFPPLTRPRRILECGYGTGAWAVAVAEAFPNCEVIGLDINPMMQPEEQLPPNVFLQVDDLNQRFTFPPSNFDLVHSRLMCPGIHINRWTQYLRDIFRVVRGGGWCQMVEIYYNVQSDNGTLTRDNALPRWSSRFFESMGGLKDLRVALRLPNLMRAAGFVDVEDRMIQLPTCAWPTEERENEIGVAAREPIQRMLSSMAIFPFTERLGMAIQDVHMLVAEARMEADNPAYKAYFPLYVCIGRKPRSRR